MLNAALRKHSKDAIWAVRNPKSAGVSTVFIKSTGVNYFRMIIIWSSRPSLTHNKNDRTILGRRRRNIGCEKSSLQKG